MKVRKVSLALALLALPLALAACAGGGATSGTATPASAPVSASAAGAPPTIELLEPVASAVVPAGEVVVRVKTSGLEFVMPSNTNVPGQGHVHFTLDDQPFKMSTEPEYSFKDVAAGPHRLKAELVQNNTQSFDPPVKQEIEFTVQ